MSIWIMVLSFLVSTSFAAITLYFIIPSLSQAKLTGTDIHKIDKPEIAEMGGLGTIVGISAGFILILSTNAFLGVPLQAVSVLAVLSTVLSVGIIGVFDDLLNISQALKAISPVLASAPLIAINAGAHMLKIPLIGELELGVLYPLVLIPLGITGAANAFNMLAGFNGMEAGTGLVAIGSLATVAWTTNSMTTFLMLLIAGGAMLGTLYFNWYPSNLLIGDVGTLTIGATIAASVIIGDFETAGLIIVAPHFIDFLFKASSSFPSEGWGGELDEETGKLISVGRVVSLPQFIMKVTGGIKERNLTLVIMGLEAVAGLFAVTIYTIW